MSRLTLTSALISAALAWRASAVAVPTVTIPKRDSCTVTDFDDVSDAVDSCTDIVLSGITVPGGETLELDLQDGTTVTFAGTTTFEYEEEDYDMIVVKGNNITITAESDAIIDGNGSAWWDGEGSNGGKDKPDHFFVVDDVTNGLITGLYIQNWPTHCFDITGCNNLIVENLILNNTAGNAPNSDSDGDPAAHNSDGFDLSNSNNTIVRNTKVWNQDDCVAVTSGDTVTISGMYCNGGHGLSIGSIGGKSDNTVTNVIFQDSQVVNSENGARIKTNSDTTGYVGNITYQNIVLSNISDYGIDIQQDYLNGGPTGDPTNGVTITGITMTNITGTATDDAMDYYILCGDGSCSDFTFNDISITGGSDSSCNYTPDGDFSCSD